MGEIVQNILVDDKIFVIRGVQVMLDRDLAQLYQVETKRLVEQVKRNIERFDEDFMFQLTEIEFENLRSQNATTNFNMSNLILMLLQNKVSICLPYVYPQVCPLEVERVSLLMFKILVRYSLAKLSS